MSGNLPKVRVGYVRCIHTKNVEGIKSKAHQETGIF
jgi:hypothetical protein